jgi:hypothetical protein
VEKGFDSKSLGKDNNNLNNDLEDEVEGGIENSLNDRLFFFFLSF